MSGPGHLPSSAQLPGRARSPHVEKKKFGAFHPRHLSDTARLPRCGSLENMNYTHVTVDSVDISGPGRCENGAQGNVGGLDNMFIITASRGPLALPQSGGPGGLLPQQMIGRGG